MQLRQVRVRQRLRANARPASASFALLCLACTATPYHAVNQHCLDGMI